MPNIPEATIIDGKITNGDQLRRYWRERHHQDYFKRRAMFDIIHQSELQQTVEDRLDTLKEISHRQLSNNGLVSPRDNSTSRTFGQKSASRAPKGRNT